MLQFSTAILQSKPQMSTDGPVLAPMNDGQNTQITDAPWPTSVNADQGKTLTLAQEIAPFPSASCNLTPTLHPLEELLDGDGPCGDPGRPFSYSAEDVYIWLHTFYGPGQQLETLLIIASEMEIGDWLTVLGAAWTGFDYVGFDSKELFYLLEERRVDYESPIIEMMTSEERRAFDALPDEITIHRGCGPMNEFGYSWSLDRAVAEAFPFKRKHTTEYPTLLTMTIQKTRAAALKLSRGEQEIILFDNEDEHSFYFDWIEEPILRGPVGEMVQSWADDPEGNLIDVWLEERCAACSYQRRTMMLLHQGASLPPVAMV